ncbi:hypothetical protein HDEF_1387 [Candidatus Hamiltonella defensa 5AT (Acyrthosiphon pisum)]|uniref:Uncharacterized protein n=1 Tax=Hamiltonella defensa subsp. Acyrthosiphon pisum (strain 5AT) TaxID=572265 RepID=C4K628_HAMD5|nr:hypothetical protein HDEF_1387 [Candidatus Hamiltonella defensa 5AT (Acyrthosiphon pisum)]
MIFRRKVAYSLQEIQKDITQARMVDSFFVLL